MNQLASSNACPAPACAEKKLALWGDGRPESHHRTTEKTESVVSNALVSLNLTKVLPKSRRYPATVPRHN